MYKFYNQTQEVSCLPGTTRKSSLPKPDDKDDDLDIDDLFAKRNQLHSKSSKSPKRKGSASLDDPETKQKKKQIMSLCSKCQSILTSQRDFIHCFNMECNNQLCKTCELQNDNQEEDQWCKCSLCFSDRLYCSSCSHLCSCKRHSSNDKSVCNSHWVKQSRYCIDCDQRV